jgi:F0F1-type ATP synthase membrane subunit b/b'
MSRLDQELSEMRTAAERDAQEEHRRLVEAAEAESRKIIDRAKQEIDGMTREAYLELKAHAASLAVEAAEGRIRAHMTDEDRVRLMDTFLSGLGEKK